MLCFRSARRARARRNRRCACARAHAPDQAPNQPQPSLCVWGLLDSRMIGSPSEASPSHNPNASTGLAGQCREAVEGTATLSLGLAAGNETCRYCAVPRHASRSIATGGCCLTGGQELYGTAGLQQSFTSAIGIARGAPGAHARVMCASQGRCQDDGVQTARVRAPMTHACFRCVSSLRVAVLRVRSVTSVSIMCSNSTSRVLDVETTSTPVPSCCTYHIVSFTRVYRFGVWYGFVRVALLLAVVLCWVDRCFGSCSWVLLHGENSKLYTPGTAKLASLRNTKEREHPQSTQTTANGSWVLRWAYSAFSVLHGESSKRLALPRNTKDRKHLQSTQSAQPTHLTDQAPSTTERTARETHNTN